ncbi:hypothetical protein [Asticcacaulis sp.]|uniref:hypothetical protein n=1 Tax=Asticcacaulis sp. TaxID=1872648 RepID=UPI0031D754EA
MNVTIGSCVMIGWLVISTCVVICAPQILSDDNAFLKGFVNHEFLGFMGVIVTITLASAGNLIIELNKMSEKIGKDVFPKTKRSVKDSAYYLIAFLVMSVFLVILKPVLTNTPQGEAIANSLAIALILASIMALTDLTRTAFNLEPIN